MRQVTSGSERRICSRSRCLKTIDHRSIHQQRMAAPLLDAIAHSNTCFDAQICNSPPTSPVDDQIDCKMGTILTISAHRIHNNSLWGVVNKNNPLTCPFHATIWLDPSTSNLLCPIFCQPDPLPDPCCRSITTLAINLLRGETKLSIHIDALVLWPLMHQSCFDSAEVR